MKKNITDIRPWIPQEIEKFIQKHCSIFEQLSLDELESKAFSLIGAHEKLMDHQSVVLYAGSNVINPNVLDTISGFFNVSVLNVAKACNLHSSFLYEPTAASELAISFETNSGATSIIFSIRCNANNFSSLDDAVPSNSRTINISYLCLNM